MASGTVFSVSIDKPTFNARAFQGAVYQGVRAASLKMKSDFELTTATWKKKPVFYVANDGTWVGTDNDLYRWLNNPTRRLVRVQKGFRAKTRYMWIGSQGGGGDIVRNADGTPRIYKPYVAEGRNWVLAIALKHFRLNTHARAIVGMVIRDLNRIFQGGHSISEMKRLANSGQLTFQRLLR